MVSFNFAALFLSFLLLVTHLQSGYSLFLLAHKKAIIKHKLHKIKEALLSDDYPHGYEEVHHYYYPVHYSGGYYGHGDKHGSGWSGYSGWHSGWHGY